MKIYAPRICGAVLVVVGVVWFGQGVGAIGGSFMTGSALWATIGVVCFVSGILLLAWGTAARRRQVVAETEGRAGAAGGADVPDASEPPG